MRCGSWLARPPHSSSKETWRMQRLLPPEQLARACKSLQEPARAPSNCWARTADMVGRETSHAYDGRLLFFAEAVWES
jgi:hypothetical protein